MYEQLSLIDLYPEVFAEVVIRGQAQEKKSEKQK